MMTLKEYFRFKNDVLTTGLCRNCLYTHFGVNLGSGEFSFSDKTTVCPRCNTRHHIIKGINSWSAMRELPPHYQTN
ncbi:MAG: hypothetical protein KBS81_11625 [Spirochaetales bacterium]|nr:hypothetical protein [Candidatus Physcosoma equi]